MVSTKTDKIFAAANLSNFNLNYQPKRQIPTKQNQAEPNSDLNFYGDDAQWKNNNKRQKFDSNKQFRATTNSNFNINFEQSKIMKTDTQDKPVFYNNNADKKIS